MRNLRNVSIQQWIVPAIVVVLTITLTVWVGWRYGQGVRDSANPLITAALGGSLVYLIFRHAYWGLALIAAILPITDALPKLPYVTSLFPIVGAATVIAFIIQRTRKGLPWYPQHVHVSYIFAVLFIIWIFLSNPQAALQNDRGVPALFTYFQLLILLWLGGEMLTNLTINRRLMWLFTIACIISSWVAIQDSSLGATFDTGGTGGLGGISSGARQFATAFIMLFFLRSGLKRGVQRPLIALTWLSQVILLDGIAITGSRTGILIAAIGFVIILLSPTSKIRPQRVIIPAVLIFTVYTVIPSTYWDSMWNSIFPAIEEGSDTVGTRYELWATAMRMVDDKPFTGVGINQFKNNVLKYSDPLSSDVKLLGAHSVYFAVIAETGVVGFVLFIGMAGSSVFYALRAAWALRDEQESLMAFTWFAVMVLLLVGGVTKHDQYDKLFWLVLGGCTAMNGLQRKIVSERRHPYLLRREIVENTAG